MSLKLKSNTVRSQSSKSEELLGLTGADYRKAWNKLNFEKCRAAVSAWRIRNPLKAKQASAQWREKNREKASQSVRAWWKKLKEETPEIAREKNRRYHASSRGSGEDKKRYYSGADQAKWRGNPWDDIEDCLIMERAKSDKQLSLELGRSVRAIQIRRCKLKKQDTPTLHDTQSNY